MNQRREVQVQVQGNNGTTMTSRERLLTALHGGVPDRVPWMELRIDPPIQIALMGGRTDFTPAELCDAVGLDAYGVAPLTAPPITSSDMLTPEYFKHEWYNPPMPSCRFFAPLIAEMGWSPDTGRTFLKRPLLKEPADLKLFDTYLPDPEDPTPYEKVQTGW